MVALSLLGRGIGRARLPVVSAVVIASLVGASCARGGRPSLESIAPREVSVHETLQIPLVVKDGGDATLRFDFEGPELPGLDRTASISGTGAGGQFRWTPLASHVGTHELTFILSSSGGGELDRESTVVEVLPSDDAAPVFLRPGAGGTYDLTRDPCVRFDAEVRDADSARVEIRTRSELPAGATLQQAEGDDKRARFEWCPSTDQIATAHRWTIELEADDGDHPPVPHDYVVVLRTDMKEGCPGAPPEITVLSPDKDERVTAAAGWPVVIEVRDDMGLRDPPLLFYSTTEPDMPENPDVTEFEQAAFELDGSEWQALVPSLGLGPGEEQRLYFVASATDNDDPSGTRCDHRTDTQLRTFLAVKGEGEGDRGVCERCSSSPECASGVCATSASGGRCVPSCDDGSSCDAGSCDDLVTREGRVVRACGGVSDVCEGGGGECVDDELEPNDSISAASPATSSVTGQICSGNDDYFRIEADEETEVEVSLDFRHADGDLDLFLLDGDGAILESSASTDDGEQVSRCMSRTESVYAKVFGYGGAENGYSMQVDSRASSCCIDDAGEPDDTRASARSANDGGDLLTFDGKICPRDEDWISFDVDDPSDVRVTLLFDHAEGDLDLELYDPDGGIVGSSRGTTDIEEIERTVAETGRYAARVFGFLAASGEYVGEIEVSPRTGCSTDSDCPSSQVCDGDLCVDRECTSASACPSGYECPMAGPGDPTSECGSGCTYNRDCRSTEACKWFAEGRYCGRKGSGRNGDECDRFSDCGGQRACVDWPDGYCARVGCSSNGDCESDTRCVAADGMNVCARDCLESSDICRRSEGYACGVRYDVEERLQFVCVPE